MDDVTVDLNSKTPPKSGVFQNLDPDLDLFDKPRLTVDDSSDF